jgi:hypothetical protein
MPVAGQPRNPFGQSPDRIELEAPRAIVQAGRTPATMRLTLRGMVQAAGQIRHDWRQTVGYIDGPPPYSWTSSDTSGPTGRAFQVTRALRYLTRSLYMGAGIDNTRFAELHSAIPSQVRSPRVTTGGGQARNKPVTRNRLTSFGARVPTLQERQPAPTRRRA